jgi:UDP-glucose 4-epimerase
VAASEQIRSELGWKPEKPELQTMVADAWTFARERPDGYSA